MADIVLSAATFLVEQVTPLILKELNLPDEVAEQMRSLQNELGILKALLIESEGKPNRNEIFKVVINQIRDAVYDSEDAIDAYIYNLHNHRRIKLWNAFKCVNRSRMLHDLDPKIRNIKQRIGEIKETLKEYGVELGHANYRGDTGAEAKAESEMAALHERRQKVEEDDVVGFEDYSEQVIEKLTRGGQRRDIFSIIGMGGLGKTTLARKIYKNMRVRYQFDCFAWATVSKDFEPKNILLSLLGQVAPGMVATEIQEQSTNELVAELRKSLQEKKYLIVLDDVWEPEAWDTIENAFPVNKNGSRVLITSRSNGVANRVSKSPLNQYELPALSEKNAWELFSKKVFQEEECPRELEDLAMQMAKSCDGLPLSIVVLASLMSNMGRSRAEWSMVAGNEICHLFNEKAECTDILALSYHYLPQKLKPCFLYVGIFPEDFEISARELIRLWVAEGFIRVEDIGKKQLEDIGELYLQQLVDRSLIQVASRRSDGGVKTSRIHDLLRELCIQVNQTEKFFDVYTGSNSSQTPAKPRRLSLYCSVPSYPSSNHIDNSSVRSLICFGEEISQRCTLLSRQESRRYWNLLIESFNLVRVIRLSDDQLLFEISNCMKKLSHLRYLRVNTNLLSCDISKLWNLETLDMRGIRVQGHPSNLRSTPIWKLKRLRHLFVSGPTGMPPLDKPLENLQSLSTVHLDDHMAHLLSNAMLPKLRKLGLYIRPILTCRLTSKRKRVNNLWQGLQNLSHLHTLKIICTSGDIESPREASWFPSTLTKITLQNEFIDEFCPGLIVLGALPNLEILKVYPRVYSFPPLSIDCKTGDFKSLRVFKIKGFGITWYLVEGAMPRLQSLVFLYCNIRNKLPDELWSLENLKEVVVTEWPEQTVDELRRRKTNDGCKLTIIS